MTTPEQIELLARALAGSYSRGVGMDDHDAMERATAILAQLGPLDPLGAVAMREKAVNAIDADGEFVRSIGLSDRIRAITLPTDDELDAAALARPKVKALVDAGQKMAKSIQGNYYLPGIAGKWDDALAALTRDV